MTASPSETVAILGGGISGLSLAWYLKKRGFKVILFEAEKETGGVIRSEINEYSIFDYGPNTIRDKTGLVLEMVTKLGLENEILSISEASKVRYVVRHGELKKVSQNPFLFFVSDVLSCKGKWDLITEPFKKAIKLNQDESIGDFLERRIGKEGVEYLVDPFFSGIYAGDIYSMSKTELIEKLASFELDYGSVFKGFLKTRALKSAKKPQLISFKKGVQQLTKGLTEELSKDIRYEGIRSLVIDGSSYKISSSEKEYKFDKVISCLPAYELGKIIDEKQIKLKNYLLSISYPPMLSSQMVFKKEDLNLPENGFGFLVPRKENQRLLGAIWKNNIFPDQTEENYIHVNLMTGGAHDHGVSKSEINFIEKEILAEFLKILNSDAKPVLVKSKLWEYSIPQFKVGHAIVDEFFNRFESEHKGFFIAGNFRWGISISDCIEGAKVLARDISS